MSFASYGEGLRHLIERLEARTAGATELRIRLELTEKAQSTLEDELADERRRREEAELEARRTPSAAGGTRGPSRSPLSPGPSDTSPNAAGRLKLPQRTHEEGQEGGRRG